MVHPYTLSVSTVDFGQWICISELDLYKELCPYVSADIRIRSLREIWLIPRLCLLTGYVLKSVTRMLNAWNETSLRATNAKARANLDGPHVVHAFVAGQDSVERLVMRGKRPEVRQ